MTVAAAGTKAKLQIWDVGANMGTRKAFATKLAEAGQILKEKQGSGLVSVEDDDGDSSDNDDAE